MVQIGVIDSDTKRFESMRRLWAGWAELVRLDAVRAIVPDALDVLLIDLESLSGHARRFLSDCRIERPSMPIVVTYLYCDETQQLEAEIRKVAAACILKPYDIDSVGKTIRQLHADRTVENRDPE